MATAYMASQASTFSFGIKLISFDPKNCTGIWLSVTVILRSSKSSGQITCGVIDGSRDDEHRMIKTTFAGQYDFENVAQTRAPTSGGAILLAHWRYDRVLLNVLTSCAYMYAVC